MRRVTIRDISRNSKILGYGQDLEVVKGGKTVGWFLPQFPSFKKIIELHGGEISLSSMPTKNEKYESSLVNNGFSICPKHNVYNKTCGCEN